MDNPTGLHSSPHFADEQPITGLQATAGTRRPGPCNKTVAQFGLALITVAIVLDALAFFVDVLAGLRIVQGVPKSEVGFEYGSTLSQMSNLTLPLAVLIGGCSFLWWFHCAYQARAGLGPTRYQPIWAVVGWLVPGVNLIRPLRIMSELTNRSPHVVSWWTFWALGAVTHVALRLITPTVQRGWVYWQTAAFIADMVLLASLAVAFTLVNEATTSRAPAHVSMRR